MTADAAPHLTPGTALPRIALPATDGTEIDLAALPGRSVIAVYPWTGRPGQPNPPRWDDIPGAHGSTPELQRFGELASRFGHARTRLFGLSGQDTAYQREAMERLELPFPLLSDAQGRFAGALALPSFATGGQSYLKRLTLVGSEGRIVRVFYSVADPATHADEVLAWLERDG